MSLETKKESISLPEPPPKPKGEPIFPLAFEAVRSIDDLSSETTRDLRCLLEERYQFGLKKYGQTLMSEDGRNSIEDARQELGDLFVYIVKALHNKENPEGVKKLIDQMKLTLKILENW